MNRCETGGRRGELTFAAEDRSWLCTVLRYPDGHTVPKEVVVVA